MDRPTAGHQCRHRIALRVSTEFDGLAECDTVRVEVEIDIEVDMQMASKR